MWYRRASVAAVVLGMCALGLGNARADKPNTPAGRPQARAAKVVEASFFGVSPAVRTLKAGAVAPDPDSETLTKLVLNRAIKDGAALAQRAPSPQADSVLQSSLPAPNMPNTTVNFPGMDDGDNFNAFGFRLRPPDTNGDVGPHNYVQAVNLLFRVYAKNGTPLSVPFKLSALFSSLPLSKCTVDEGDPIVNYDPLADRWVLSQFGVVGSPIYSQCFAVSTTSDPTGSYYVYDFLMPNTKFNDYPKVGVWTDAYYMMDHQFDPGFVGTGIFAFEREKMLMGQAARYVYFDLGTVDPNIGGGLPADIDGVPPPKGTPGLFAYLLATAWGDPVNGLRLFDIAINWTTPANSTFTERAESPVVVAAYDPNMCGYNRNCIPQPPPSDGSTKLDAISDRLMHRMAYRNFGTYQSLVVAHTVDADAADHAGVRYYELRNTSGAYTAVEQATFAPDSDNRWMGSAAMDNKGNLAVGYSVSSAATFPSIRYAGRLATDPANGLFQGESEIIAGSGSQMDNIAWRWGDYSSMSVDPADDCTFWYTQEYYNASNLCPTPSIVCWRTQIANFKFPSCTPPALGTLAGNVYDANTLAPIGGAIVITDQGYTPVTNASGQFSLNVAPGTYKLFARKYGYADSSTVTVGVAANATTTVSLAMQPVPVIVYQSTSLVSDGNASGTLEKNECATIAITIRNDSPTATAIAPTVILKSLTAGVYSNARRTYANIAPLGTGTQNFTLTTDSTYVNGEAINFELDVRFGAYTTMIPFTWQPPFASATTSFSATGPIAIPDDTGPGGAVDLNVAVSGLTNPIGQVTAVMYVTHTWDGDLTISLIGPDNTEVPLSIRRGGGGDNFGTDCPASGNDTIFLDSAATAISAGIAPFVGSYRPETPLSAFNGKTGAAVNGIWKLHAYDSAGGDTGNIECVTLQITTVDPAATGPGLCPYVVFTGGTALEGDTSTTNATWNFFQSLTGAATVYVTTASGSAKQGVDFGGYTNASIGFGAGTGSGTVTVPHIFGDRIDEGNETYNVNVNTTTAGVIVAGTNLTGDFTTVITDNDTKFDFDRTGASFAKADILWRDTATGTNAMWLMNGTAISTSGLTGSITDPNWTVAGAGDFNNDGKADIFWRNPVTGQNALWLMNGTAITATGYFTGIPNDWVVGGVADFNGDSKADILWRTNTTGQIASWFMNGISVSSTAVIGTLPSDWVAAGVGDFNNDDRADILWRNTTTGDNAIWLMNGSTLISGGLISSIPGSNWQVQGVGDFNADSKADILWEDVSTGMAAIWLMDGTSVSSTAVLGTLTPNYRARVADFNGDNHADILWRDTSNGDVAMWLMNGTTISTSAFIGNLPTSWVVGAPR
jgi:subtilisin-like proprotein convertase family protein